jgi:RecA-family ATPase
VGLGTVQGSSLYVSCEDDADELHRRHADIRKGLGYAIGNPFAATSVWDRTGYGNLLAVPDQSGVLVEGPFLGPLRAALAELRPTLVILDTLADVYGGNEVDRVQVNGFLKTCLGGLIREREQDGHELTVLLLGHPSKTALVDGSGFSGSTAWENAVRSRLYLARPDNAGPDERTLTRAKANYAGGDDGELAIMWSEGLFVAHDKEAELRVQAMATTVANEVASAWRAGQPYNERRGHPRYLHAAIKRALDTPSNPPGLVVQGLRRAIDDGLIYPSKNTAKRGWRTPVE